jgi:hypothetical protein
LRYPRAGGAVCARRAATIPPCRGGHPLQEEYHTIPCFVKILEIHDFNIPEDSDDDQLDSHNSDSSGDDGYPGYDPSCGMLQSCKWVLCLIRDHSPMGEPWPSLPSQGGGMAWPLMMRSRGEGCPWHASRIGNPLHGQVAWMMSQSYGASGRCARHWVQEHARWPSNHWVM